MPASNTAADSGLVRDAFGRVAVIVQQAAADAQAATVASGNRDDTVSYLIEDGASRTYRAISRDFMRRTALSGLLPWRASYVNRDNAPAKVVVLGSQEGQTLPHSSRWSYRLEELLRDGAVGGHWHNASGGATSLAGDATASDHTQGKGLGGHQVAIGSGGTVTLPGEAMTSFKVYYRKHDFFAGDAVVKVDGATVATLDGNSTPYVDAVHTQAVTPGTHTIVIEGIGINAQKFHLQAIETFNGDETKGVRVHDGSMQGQRLRDMTTTWYEWDINHWRQVEAINPNLVIVNGGDADWLTNAVAFIEPLFDGLIDKIDSMVARKFSLLLVLPPRPVPAEGVTVDPAMYAYLAKLFSDKAAANPDYVSFLDMGEYWPRLESGGATSLGLMVESEAPQTPSELGHQWIASVLADLLR